MTRDEMIEKLAKHIAPMLDIWDSEKEIAAAVLDLCGPKPLVWEPELVLATGLYNWKCEIPSGRELEVFHSWWGMQNVWGYVFDGEYYHTQEAAQAAAQAHADAAHWANTRMGDV